MNNRRRFYNKSNSANRYEKNFVQPQVNTFQTNTALITLPNAAATPPINTIEPPMTEVKTVEPILQYSPMVSEQVKNEPIEDESVSAVTAKTEIMDTSVAENETTSSSQTLSEFIAEKKNGLHKKKSSVIIKEKRIRENRRLHKILTPKNALMALNELKSDCLSKFNIVGQGTNFNAEIVLNNIRYEGEGTTKAAAKLDASEKAFRDLILLKMTQKQKRDITKQDSDGDTLMETDPEEEIPMVHLASFALHKLFSEWEAEGFSVPDLRGGPQIAPIQSGLGSAEQLPQPEKAPFIRTELPDNHETLHPCMLLSIMRPGQTFEDLGSNGQAGSNNISHCMGITVDGEKFLAHARSKKIARKVAAIDACNKLFGTNFKNDELA